MGKNPQSWQGREALVKRHFTEGEAPNSNFSTNVSSVINLYHALILLTYHPRRISAGLPCARHTGARTRPKVHRKINNAKRRKKPEEVTLLPAAGAESNQYRCSAQRPEARCRTRRTRSGQGKRRCRREAQRPQRRGRTRPRRTQNGQHQHHKSAALSHHRTLPSFCAAARCSPYAGVKCRTGQRRAGQSTMRRAASSRSRTLPTAGEQHAPCAPCSMVCLR